MDIPKTPDEIVVGGGNHIKPPVKTVRSSTKQSSKGSPEETEKNTR